MFCTGSPTGSRFTGGPFSPKIAACQISISSGIVIPFFERSACSSIEGREYPNRQPPTLRDQARRSDSAARSASPCATDVNSFPPRIRDAPNRLSKIRRTAGTNEDPPVRKTRSTASGSTPELSQKRVNRAFDRLELLFDPRFKLRPRHGNAQVHAPSAKSKFGILRARQFELQLLHRLVQLVSKILIHNRDQGFDLFRLQALESVRSSESRERCSCAETRGSASARDSRRSTPEPQAEVC